MGGGRIRRDDALGRRAAMRAGVVGGEEQLPARGTRERLGPAQGAEAIVGPEIATTVQTGESRIHGPAQDFHARYPPNIGARKAVAQRDGGHTRGPLEIGLTPPAQDGRVDGPIERGGSMSPAHQPRLFDLTCSALTLAGHRDDKVSHDTDLRHT